MDGHASLVHKPRVAIVGYGAVGQALHELFPDAILYDKPKGIGTQQAVNACVVGFVAVPTPGRPDGRCDLSIVEEVVDWLECDRIVICSTVEVGTTCRLREKTGKRLVFQPMYGPGQTPSHPFRELKNVGWIILGGNRADTIPVADLYKDYVGAELEIHQTDSDTAELCKYMENAFLATKVAFCNEFYDLALSWGVDYNELRELWLLDPRIGRSHTFVRPHDRGFGGKCLPKDLDALLAAARDIHGVAPILLTSVLHTNAEVLRRKQIGGDD